MTNHLNFLHGVFAFAVKRRWVAANPVATVDRPRQRGANPDIRFLELEEVEAVLRAVPGDLLGPTERALYLTAAMTGLRQGELIALRWKDIDWTAGRVRVRQNRVRGQYGTPKSRRGSRAVPLADRVAAELERHFQRSPLQDDADLVFAHPSTGEPLDLSKLLNGASRTRSRRPGSARSASMICGTHSGRGWRRPVSRFAPCRSGWATATTRRRWCTRTTSPTIAARRSWWSARSRPVTIPVTN